MRIVLLGAPGAGKGTQAAALATHSRVPVLSTGDMMRREASSGSEAGRSIQRALQIGTLIADELVLAAVFGALAGDEARDGFILDGFPRTVSQAVALDQWLASASVSLDAAFDFELDEEELLRRVLGRAVEARTAGKAGRIDDNAEAFRIRLAEYRLHAAPLREYYASARLLRGVNASDTPDGITRSILSALRLADHDGSQSP